MTTSASLPRNGAGAHAHRRRPPGPSTRPRPPVVYAGRSALEFTYPLRGIDDAELHQRLAHAVPWLLALVKGVEAETVPPAPVPWDPGVLPTASTPPPTATAVPEDWCPRHQVIMDHHRNAKGEWYSHRLDDGTYCKGK